jgi:magnesium-transporting ATPase (P-type)
MTDGAQLHLIPPTIMSSPSPATSPLPGLSDAEAAARLTSVGPNRLVPEDPWAWLKETVAILADPMALMLGATATVYLLLGETRDGIILLLALIPVLGVDVFLHARSREALKQLADQPGAFVPPTMLVLSPQAG